MQLKNEAENIGLLGGTFDPVHNGHLAVADHVLQTLVLDAVWFIPAPSPPHKASHGDGLALSSFSDRAAMLDRAVTPFDRFSVSRIEAERPAPSYSVDTLRELHRRASAATRFYFILGADAFAEIDTWKQYTSLPDHADLVIVSRADKRSGTIEDTIGKRYPDYRRAPAPVAGTTVWTSAAHAGSIVRVCMEPVPISSTKVRDLVRQGRDVSMLVPPAVEEYIRMNNLYRPDRENSG